MKDMKRDLMMMEVVYVNFILILFFNVCILFSQRKRINHYLINYKFLYLDLFIDVYFYLTKINILIF